MTESSLQVTPDILVLQFRVVNAYIVSYLENNSDKWVLVDTGLENSAEFIIKCAIKKFGENSKPEAMILTHGHFDHVDFVKKLSKY